MNGNDFGFTIAAAVGYGLAFALVGLIARWIAKRNEAKDPSLAVIVTLAIWAFLNHLGQG